MAPGRPCGPDIPAVFRTLGLRFHQDSDGLVVTEDAAALLPAGGFSGETRQAPRTDLGGILRSACDDELARPWNSACPDWIARDGGDVRRMLRLIPDTPGQGRTDPGWRPVGEGLDHGRPVWRIRPAEGGRA